MAQELAVQAPMTYTLDTGKEIKLDYSIVRDVCGGGNQAISDRECFLFMELCASHKLNPFTKEAYLVKYRDNPATIIVGKDAFTKRATRNPKYRGHDAGIIVSNANGEEKKLRGERVPRGWTLEGGWAEVAVEGYVKNPYTEVALREYNTGKSNWAKMPGTMIRKVALVHALREAFPDDVGGLYTDDEMQQSFEPMPVATRASSAPVVVQPEPVDEATEKARTDVGALMRLMKSEGWNMADLHAYAQRMYLTSIKDMSTEQLTDFAKDLDRMYQEAKEAQNVIEFEEVEEPQPMAQQDIEF